MKKQIPAILLTLLLTLILSSCQTKDRGGKEPETRIPVILDSDANNELDDQHAIAYLLLNDAVFETIGITVNATFNGGEIGEQLKEAERVIRLCGMKDKIPLLAGANADFPEISGQLDEAEFDGHQAVDFIIREALKERSQKLVLLPVGKLTNIALALQKEPAIAGKVRVVWLGSNYPEPGEYNLDNDTASLNYILNSELPFEMVTVRYGKPSGTGAVIATQDEIFEKMPGLGPWSPEAVRGRHGGEFHTFGDYSVSLFSYIDFYDEAKSRSLFDMAAVAIVKNPSWAESREIPCPLYVDDRWKERADNSRKILIWENFDRDRIMSDFYATFKQNEKTKLP